MVPSAGGELGKEHRQTLDAARQALGVRQLVFGIQDPAFPGEPEEDLGRGTPYSRGAMRLFDQVRSWGFTGVQLGPQGETSADNPSPYDGTAFSKNPLNAHLPWLVERGLLEAEAAAQLVEEAAAHATPERSQHRATHARVHRALDGAWQKLRAGDRRWAEEVGRFHQAHAGWLEPDALYAPLQRLHGAWDFRRWAVGLDQRLWAPAPGEEPPAEARRNALLDDFAPWVERHAFVQWVVHEQHRELRQRLVPSGLLLYGDLAIGLSAQDLWSRRGLFLADYALGAPPSRTTPEGQPWGYPVLDPDQYDGPFAKALEFVRARVSKLLAEFDGLRIDHPHGLVCPWVYRLDATDPLESVRAGARLFDSPDLPEHPALARYAIARPEQLDQGLPRYADGWVRWLEPAQVARYGRVFDEIVATAARAGRSAEHLVCEILSTQPRPLQEVLARHGLGRFRVIQKASLDDPGDVYRSENARPEDWMMVGNHDTPSIWAVAQRWHQAGLAGRHAAQLAERLVPGPERERRAWAEAFAADPRLLAHGKLAELFAGAARQVMIFFTDVYGHLEPYNVPGTTSDANWSLRLPVDHLDRHRRAVREGRALDPAWAFAMALRAKGHPPEGLVSQLLHQRRTPHPFQLTRP